MGGERMTPARVLAAAGLALVFLTSASVALAAGRVALVVGNSTYSHIARLPNPENDAAGHGGGVAAARVRGDDRTGCGPHVTERGVAGLHPGERGGRRGAGLLRRPRPGDGRA